MNSLKISVDYLNDNEGRVKAVQLSLEDWQKVLKQLSLLQRKKEIKNDIEMAFKEVELMKAGKKGKKTMQEFLNEI